MAFPVEKDVDLSMLGPNWNGASITLSSLTFKETNELSTLSVDPSLPAAESNKKSYDGLVTLLARKFVRGKAWNGEAIVDLKPTDIPDLPMEVINKCIEAITGSVNPN